MDAERTLLLVEDDEDIRDIMGEALRSHGYHVLLGTNGRDALNQLDSAAVLPRVILLDLMMPDMDGRELLGELRRDARFKDLPVVIITASGRTAQAQGDLDVVAWLFKPVELDDLLSAVSRFCSPPVPQTDARANLRATEFLRRRRAELPSLRVAVDVGGHDELRRVGHNLRGVGATYGFAEMGDIGTRLEAAAVAGDAAAEGKAVDELDVFLRRAKPEAD